MAEDKGSKEAQAELARRKHAEQASKAVRDRELARRARVEHATWPPLVRGGQ